MCVILVIVVLEKKWKKKKYKQTLNIELSFPGKKCGIFRAVKGTLLHAAAVYSVFLWIPPVWFNYPEIKAMVVKFLKLIT